MNFDECSAETIEVFLNVTPAEGINSKCITILKWIFHTGQKKIADSCNSRKYFQVQNKTFRFRHILFWDRIEKGIKMLLLKCWKLYVPSWQISRQSYSWDKSALCNEGLIYGAHFNKPVISTSLTV